MYAVVVVVEGEGNAFLMSRDLSIDVERLVVLMSRDFSAPGANGQMALGRYGTVTRYWHGHGTGNEGNIFVTSRDFLALMSRDFCLPLHIAFVVMSRGFLGWG